MGHCPRPCGQNSHCQTDIPTEAVVASECSGMYSKKHPPPKKFSCVWSGNAHRQFIGAKEWHSPYFNYCKYINITLIKNENTLAPTKLKKYAHIKPISK